MYIIYTEERPVDASQRRRTSVPVTLAVPEQTLNVELSSSHRDHNAGEPKAPSFSSPLITYGDLHFSRQNASLHQPSRRLQEPGSDGIRSRRYLDSRVRMVNG